MPKKKDIVKEKEDFTEDDLQKYWNEYIEALRLKGEKRLAALLSNSRPKPKGLNLVMEFDNPLSVKEFGSISEKLLRFLQNKLHNHFIAFEIVQVEAEYEEDITKYYTREERIKRLIELNPVIKDLVQKLKLE